MSNKKRKTSKVEFEYTGIEKREDVPDNVTFVRFHSSVTEVGGYAFYECRQLKQVVLNEGLKKIGCESFYCCRSLEHINLPSTLLEVNERAFYRCVNLREVVLNEGLERIGTNAFYGCEALKSINLSSTITEISDYAFCRSGLGEVVLNETLHTIGKGAFASCALEYINLASTALKKIGRESFRDCKSLKSITFPSTTTEVDGCAFASCYSLKTVILNEGLQTIGEAAFSNCRSLECITIPSTVTEISSNTFYNCQRLREVGLHKGIHKIDRRTFEMFTSLERFTFPTLSTRLESIIRAGQTEVEDDIDIVRSTMVQRRGSELFIPYATLSPWRDDIWKAVREGLGRIDRTITYYELKEATTLLELAMWKANIDKAEVKPSIIINRDKYRIDIPGPVKDNIVQYLNWG